MTPLFRSSRYILTILMSRVFKAYYITYYNDSLWSYQFYECLQVDLHHADAGLLAPVNALREIISDCYSPSIHRSTRIFESFKTFLE